VQKFNYHSCWVKMMIGAKTYCIIKRHNVKHHVAYETPNQNEDIS
jgi:hypothetical protein